MKRSKIYLCLLVLLAFADLLSDVSRAAETIRPNVIFILADDLGYGDLGCYGQQRIQTPQLDQMAAEGLRFTQAYAGSTVCAPSRGSLLTGKHTGHGTIRGNRADRQKPETPLGSDEITIPEIFRKAGYSTALIGKWGCGENGSSGAPNSKGFDYFLGYLTQTAAHDYYPEFLWRNAEKYSLPENEGGAKKIYTHDLFLREALSYVRQKRSEPFFLYLALTIPHANNEEKPNGMQVPDDAPYSGKDWPATERNFAAMITRMDCGIGQLLAFLKELQIDDRTLVIFTSDNGPHAEGGHDAGFFKSSGELRGRKRDLYDGGIRVPMLVRWPGRIKPRVSDQVVAFWDWLPTFAELIGQPASKGADGVSLLPVLLDDKAISDRTLYWEFYEQGFFRAVRLGYWKGVSLDPAKPLELYQLAADPSEKRNVAAENPEVARQIEAIMKREHIPSPLWTP